MTRVKARILLVSGIFYPDVGGPAIHVQKIATAFTERGWDVTVVAFGDEVKDDFPYRVRRVSRRSHKLVSWLQFARVVIWETISADIVYAFDLTTAGIPACCASFLLHRPFMVRIGGDPIWERLVEKGHRNLPLDRYYRESLHKKDRPLLYRVLRLIVRRADHIVVYSDMFKNFYVRYFGATENRITVIPNPVPSRSPFVQPEEPFTFLFAGRFVHYKNLLRVVRAASSIRNIRLLFIGDGPEEQAIRAEAEASGVRLEIKPKIGQTELFAHIDQSAVALAPALTEFNPNFILESIARGKPAIISRNNGLSLGLPSYMQIDPEDDGSVVSAMKHMTDPHVYEAAIADIAALPTGLSWRDVTDSHTRLVEKYLS